MLARMKVLLLVSCSLVTPALWGAAQAADQPPVRITSGVGASRGGAEVLMLLAYAVRAAAVQTSRRPMAGMWTGHGGSAAAAGS